MTPTITLSANRFNLNPGQVAKVAYTITADPGTINNAYFIEPNAGVTNRQLKNGTVSGVLSYLATEGGTNNQTGFLFVSTPSASLTSEVLSANAIPVNQTAKQILFHVFTG